jgi:hypothetical protein
MYKSVFFATLCAVSSLACEFTCFEDCDSSDGDHQRAGASAKAGGSSGGRNAAGGTSSTGNDSGGSAACGDSGGTANAPGTGGHTVPPATACTEESDCERGFNCDYERKECVAAGAETCAELQTEADCDNRNDCVSTYAGTNCSCGPECMCIGGEPGCVCESFAFFRCEPLGG